ncbi:malonate--CoA ligase [Rhodovibrio salinarum]|uniref:Malonyl-CoA synthase n=1 Tax=Rhodovibrio salinarum TaxID=1087 RepID=A0A934V174_9PROT|nr:malonyl-CoA synthase [Rhodovibrio salinarum]MBK1697889.1 malonyl-CoA synthase [Rhodovibrio salinarum]
MSGNLYERFLAVFSERGDAPAIELADGTTWSYAQLTDQVGRLARRLVEAGVEPGDRVAIQVDKSPQALFTYLACFQAGAVYLPLNTAYTGPEVSYFLSDAQPRCFVCDPRRADELAPIAGEAGVSAVLNMDPTGAGTLTDGLDAVTPMREVVERDPDDLAAICYTSGTTGRSKGAMLSHRNLESNARTLHSYWGFQDGDVLLHALPLFHVHGLFVASNTALLNGSKMLFLPKFDADQVTRLLPKASVMMGVPTFYVRLLERDDFTKDLVAKMRLFVSGSAPLQPETWRQFKERTGFEILERYGMTEAGMITSNPLNGERRPGTVGFPLPNVQVRVAKEDGTVLGTEEIGILEIKGPNLFQGYWNKPEKTAEEFRPDGFFITGDNAKIDDRGYVHIVGRAKDLIISGGYNVYPKEIELTLDAMNGVKESAVFGVPHPDFGEAVTAMVVAEAGKEDTLSEKGLIDACRTQIAGYKTPKRIFFADTLPRNTMGKVQKAQLRSEYESTFQGAA